MNETTLINTLANAIHDDVTLKDWCTTKYTRRHKIYKGVDPRNPPDPASDYPAINIVIEGKKEGYDLESREHEVTITGGLNESAAKVNTREYLIEYKFMENMVTFVNYIKDVVVASSLGNLEIAEYDVLYDEITFFPSVIFEMHLMFKEDYYQGATVFE